MNTEREKGVIAAGPVAVIELESALDGGTVLAAPDEPTRRDAPRELLRIATLRGLLRMAAEEWTVIVGCWALLLVLPPAWRVAVYAPIALVLAGRFHALGIVLHDAAHMVLRRISVAALAVEALCGYPIASTIDAMRYHHLRHHRDSGMETDPYFKTGGQTPLWWTLNVLRGVLLVPFWTLRALVGALALALPGLRNAYARVFLQDRTTADVTQSRELISCARAELRQLLAQLLFAAVAVRWPLPVLLGYVIPVTIAGVLAARRLLLEHLYEHTTDRRVSTIIATTRDNHLGWLGRLVLAPRNVGCHIVHHIHPQVGLEHLPRLRAWYVARHPGLYPPPRR